MTDGEGQRGLAHKLHQSRTHAAWALLALALTPPGTKVLVKEEVKSYS